MAASWSEDVEFMDALTETVLYSISAFPRKLVHTDELVHKHELPFAQIQLLSLLAVQDMSVSEAARTLNVAKTNLALLVRELTRKGYLERIPDTTDKRKASLHLTEDGHAKYVEIKCSVIDQMKKLAGEFNRSEMHELMKAINQVNHVLYQI
jgi:DNA-binding MarR family transcriptional regulator